MHAFLTKHISAFVPYKQNKAQRDCIFIAQNEVSILPTPHSAAVWQVANTPPRTCKAQDHYESWYPLRQHLSC